MSLSPPDPGHGIGWLPPDLSTALAAEAERLEFPAGARLFREGDAADAFFVIEAGVVRIQREHEELDTDPVLSLLEAGRTFGELGLLDDEPRAASAYADEALRVWKFPRAALARLERENPAIAAAFYHHLGREAARKLRAANERRAGSAAQPEEEDGEVDELVAAAASAQKEIACWPEERIDILLEKLANAIAARAAELAELTVAVTHLGNAADKTRKNEMASLGVFRDLQGRTGLGLLGSNAETGVAEYAAPAGVVFALVPVTNPVATAIFKSLICLKSRNAVILSFHRAARELARAVGEILQGTLAEAGAPVALIQWVRVRNSRRKTERFFAHPGVALILATGGRSMVQAAYSSGKPAIGVGPGNAPVLIGSDCDLRNAAACIVESKSFDHGVICGSENNLVVPQAVFAEFALALEATGAAVLNPKETAAFRAMFVLEEKATLRRSAVGQAAAEIAQSCGITRPFPIRLLVVPAGPLDPADAMAREKTAPIVGLFTVPDETAGVELCGQLLELEGCGHTAVIHSRNEQLVEQFALRLPASRILVGSPASQGVVGATTGLIPSFMLGCGFPGGNSTSDNITFTHVRHLKRLARIQP